MTITSRSLFKYARRQRKMNGPEQAKQKDVIEKQLDLDWSLRLCLNVTLT